MDSQTVSPFDVESFRMPAFLKKRSFWKRVGLAGVILGAVAGVLTLVWFVDPWAPSMTAQAGDERTPAQTAVVVKPETRSSRREPAAEPKRPEEPGREPTRTGAAARPTDAAEETVVAPPHAELPAQARSRPEVDAPSKKASAPNSAAESGIASGGVREASPKPRSTPAHVVATPVSKPEDDAELLAARARLEELRKRAAEPAIQALYRPFLSKGKFPFYDRGTIVNRWVLSWYDYPQPASLKRLRECGVLKNAAVFWKTGSALPAPSGPGMPDKYGYFGQGYGNDRPTWHGAPRTEAEAKRIAERYREFLELAPIWVETGVLRP